jgi:hypothetical protein
MKNGNGDLSLFMYGLEAENLEKYRSLLRNSLYSSTKEIFD